MKSRIFLIPGRLRPTKEIPHSNGVETSSTFAVPPRSIPDLFLVEFEGFEMLALPKALAVVGQHVIVDFELRQVEGRPNGRRRGQRAPRTAD